MSGDHAKDGPACMHWGRIGKMCPQCGIDLAFSGPLTVIERFVLEATALIATLVLNMVDTMLTLAGARRGILLEVNPLLASLVDVPWLFIIVKMGLVAIGLFLLWRYRSHRWVMSVSLCLFGAYITVIIYHLYGLLDLCNEVS